MPKFLKVSLLSHRCASRPVLELHEDVPRRVGNDSSRFQMSFHYASKFRAGQFVIGTYMRYQSYGLSGCRTSHIEPMDPHLLPWAHGAELSTDLLGEHRLATTGFAGNP